MWVVGMKYGYRFGFLLIIPAVAIGVSLPFIIGSNFHHKIEGWLEKYPKKVSILKSAGGGSWFHQFRAVALIRVSPFLYMIYNYCVVATNVKYGPYIIGSLVGIVPEIFVALYTLDFLDVDCRLNDPLGIEGLVLKWKLEEGFVLNICELQTQRQ
ncbi:hypothetical protein RYX36_027873 [Vicia faba]